MVDDVCVCGLVSVHSLRIKESDGLGEYTVERSGCESLKALVPFSDSSTLECVDVRGVWGHSQC